MPPTKIDDPPARDASVLRLVPTALIALGGFLAMGIPLAVLPVYVHDVLGFGAVTVGIVVGIQSIATVMTRSLAGRRADEQGPKRAVLLGLPSAAAAGALYAAATLIGEAHVALAVIVLARLMTGFAESLFLTGTMAWGIGRIGASRTGMVMGWQGLAIYGALALGAPLGVALYARAGFAGVGFATMAAPLLAIGIAIALTSVAPTGAAGRRMPFVDALVLVRRQGFGLALSAAPFAGLSAFVALDYAERGWAGAGLALSGFGVGFVVVRMFLSYLPDRFGGREVGIACFAVEVVGQAMMWFAPTPVVSIAGAVVTGLGSSLVFPALGVEVIRRAPPESRALAFAGYVAFLDMALAVTGPLLGLLVARQGFAATYAAGVAACLAGLALVLLAPRERQAG